MRVAAVVVTHNRLELLKNCVNAIRTQSRRPDEILVINNASTDGTFEWLSDQEDITVITQNNSGSSGGQCTGIKAAYHKGHDWFWCMDDDTVPTIRCLEVLLQSLHSANPTTGFLASLVLWEDGSIHRMNVPTLKPAHLWLDNVLSDHSIAIKSCSFVSVLFARTAIKDVGLPIRDLFIWYDDVEYTSRISSRYRGYLILGSVAEHHTTSNAPSLIDARISSRVPREFRERYRVGLRNKVFVLRKSDLPPRDKVFFITMLLAKQIPLVLTRQITFGMMLGGWAGLMYNPEIEQVTDESRDHQSL